MPRTVLFVRSAFCSLVQGVNHTTHVGGGWGFQICTSPDLLSLQWDNADVLRFVRIFLGPFCLPKWKAENLRNCQEVWTIVCHIQQLCLSWDKVKLVCCNNFCTENLFFWTENGLIKFISDSVQFCRSYGFSWRGFGFCLRRRNLCFVSEDNGLLRSFTDALELSAILEHLLLECIYVFTPRGATAFNDVLSLLQGFPLVFISQSSGEKDYVERSQVGWLILGKVRGGSKEPSPSRLQQGARLSTSSDKNGVQWLTLE